MHKIQLPKDRRSMKYQWYWLLSHSLYGGLSVSGVVRKWLAPLVSWQLIYGDGYTRDGRATSRGRERGNRSPKGLPSMTSNHDHSSHLHVYQTRVCAGSVVWIASGPLDASVC
mgnify:CR=1 FL=1